MYLRNRLNINFLNLFQHFQLFNHNAIILSILLIFKSCSGNELGLGELSLELGVGRKKLNLLNYLNHSKQLSVESWVLGVGRIEFRVGSWEKKLNYLNLLNLLNHFSRRLDYNVVCNVLCAFIQAANDFVGNLNSPDCVLFGIMIFLVFKA